MRFRYPLRLTRVASSCLLVLATAATQHATGIAAESGQHLPRIDVANQLHLWSERFGDASGQAGRSIAVDADGNLLVCGDFQGELDLGDGPLTSAGSRDIFVAKFDFQGMLLWGQAFGDASSQRGMRVAVDAAGNVFVAGAFEGEVNFGGSTLTSAGDEDGFLVKFDPDGIHLWSIGFGDASAQQARGLATDAGGNVVVCGDFQGEVDFGLGDLASAGAEDVFLVKLDADGAPVWNQRFGDASAQAGTCLGVDGMGDILLAGDFQGEIGFGGTPLMSAGSEDVFLSKFEADGDHVWSHGFGDASIQVTGDLATDSMQQVILTGSFLGDIDFGGGALTATGSFDIFLAKFDDAGVEQWSESYGDGSTQSGRAVRVDSADEILLSGDFHGTLDLGSGVMMSQGSSDVFLGKFDASGGPLWSGSFGDGSSQNGRGLCVDAGGRVTLVGDFQGGIDFGAGVLTSAGSTDLFLAQFGPALEVTGQVRYWNPAGMPFRLLGDTNLSVCGAQANRPGSPFCIAPDGSGNFMLLPFGITGSGVPTLGPVEITATRTTDVVRDYPVITGNDAMLLFQHAAALVMLSADQQRAGDVNPGGGTSLADAIALAKFLAFVTEPGTVPATWDFDFVHETAPGSPVTTPGLASFAIGNGIPIVVPENVSVRAFLLGDVDGSYPTPFKTQAPAPIALDFAPFERRGDELIVRLQADVTQEALRSLVFSLTYDATELEYQGLESGARTSEFYTFANPARDGVVHGVALGWKAAAGASGEVLVLRFRAKRASLGSALGFSRLQVNDRAADRMPELLLAGVRTPRQFEVTVVPNPFNPATRIEYGIPAESGPVPVQLRIYDGGGRLVYAAPQEQRAPGLHAHRWEGIDQDGRPVASGIYFVRIDAGPWSETRKLSLLK